jgi:hypothetical protein
MAEGMVTRRFASVEDAAKTVLDESLTEKELSEISQL